MHVGRTNRTGARIGWIAAAAVLLLAGPALSAQVVKLRVGDHDMYTRVVFELDAPAGYSIERLDAQSEVRITLEASSSPRRIERKHAMVSAVWVDASKGRSVARIRLRKKPSRGK